ncbi:hypothetical protein FPH37_24880 [Escherichia coli]|nr:hypothetical protein FPH37_24880 [Escherichia coli]
MAAYRGRHGSRQVDHRTQRALRFFRQPGIDFLRPVFTPRRFYLGEVLVFRRRDLMAGISGIFSPIIERNTTVPVSRDEQGH